MLLRQLTQLAAKNGRPLLPRQCTTFGSHGALRSFAGMPLAAPSRDYHDHHLDADTGGHESAAVGTHPATHPRVVAVSQRLGANGRGGGGRVAFTFDDGSEFAPSARWVRDHCRCPNCIDQGTLQRLIDPAPLVLLPADAHVVGGHAISADDVAVCWADAGAPKSRVAHEHTSAALSTAPCARNVFPQQWLWQASQEVHRCRDRDPTIISRIAAAAPAGAELLPSTAQPWLAAEYAAVDAQQRGRLQFADLGDPAARGTSRHKDAVFELLSQLERYGLAFIEGVPPSHDGTEALIRSFGAPRPTIWGTMWGTTVDL
jgi:hypothetical protein